jgi:hypothetical protein
LAWLWALPVILLTGCGGKVGDIASSVKEAAQQGMESVTEKAKDIQQNMTAASQSATDTVKEELKLAGKLELTVDQPVKTSACYASFTHVKAAHAGILQLQSYRDGPQESFPSVVVRAQSSAAAVSELAGQTLAAHLFVQSQPNGPIWFTQSELVQLKVTSVDRQTIQAEIVSGTLAHSGSGTTQAVAGTFQGVLQ